LKEALALFYSLEKEFPKHQKIDEILFFIGFVEMESGNTKKGMGYLERVVKLYPRSRKFDEAVVYLGDYYFDKVQFREAIGKFNILLRRPDSPMYHYAIYKLAWCELNTYQQVKGLRRMKGLISTLKGTQDKSKFNLREQSLRDLVIFYGETEAVDEAIEFFTAEQGKVSKPA
jgi:TolA-binding protein